MKEKVEIQKVCTRKKNGVVPTMLKFQNGKLSAFTKSNTHFCQFKRKEKTKQLNALLVANGHAYEGRVNDTESNQLTDNYICVRNKVTNKMTIIPMDQVNLKNIIYHDVDKVKRESLPKNISKLTLLKKFSGRKASRFFNDQAKMRMDIKLVQNELQSTVEEAKTEENELDKMDENTEYLDRIRPPINKDAENVSEVYNIEDVIPIELLNRLDEEAKMVYQTQIDQIPINSEYLKNLIQTIQQSQINNESLLRLKIILYMDCLLRLIRSRAKSLKKVELSDISEKIENNVRNRFADPNASFSGSRTAFSTEKALCYFIVLSLLVSDNYQIEGSILSQELNAAQSKVFKYAHIVQALPKYRSSILCLKLPKNVPPLALKFSRKRKM